MKQQKRWCKDGFVFNSVVDEFLREITAVCQKHGLGLQHEDRHGAFRVCDYDNADMEWVEAAGLEGDLKGHSANEPAPSGPQQWFER